MKIPSSRLVKVLSVALLSLMLGLGSFGLVRNGLTLYRNYNCQTSWIGEIDSDFAARATSDLERLSSCARVRINLVSPGGSAILSYHIARLVRNASNAGQIIEIHGRTIVASGATFIMAAGTPGYRYIARDTTTLIHPLKSRQGWGEPPVCVTFVPNPIKEEDIVSDTVLMILARQLAEFTGQPYKQTIKWFDCEAAFGGDGLAMIVRGIADKLED